MVPRASLLRGSTVVQKKIIKRMSKYTIQVIDVFFLLNTVLSTHIKIKSFILILYLIYSAKITEEKLRYAAYNCVAIDTDMSPWDEWRIYQNPNMSQMWSMHSNDSINIFKEYKLKRKDFMSWGCEYNNWKPETMWLCISVQMLFCSV